MNENDINCSQKKSKGAKEAPNPVKVGLHYTFIDSCSFGGVLVWKETMEYNSGTLSKFIQAAISNTFNGLSLGLASLQESKHSVTFVY